MDFLKSQFDRIQAQISALTPTQKMLTGTLVAIMVMTLMWWSRYAGTAEMEPVLNQALTQEDMTRMEATLAEKNIEYKEASDRLLVPTERKREALSVLGFNGVLPKDTASGFDEEIKQLSPWDGVGRQNAVYNRAKELELSQIVSMYPDVASAKVLIDAHTERHIGADVEAKASVMVQMKPGTKPGKQLAKAAAKFVAGAQSGLALKNITVVIDGIAQNVADEGADGSTIGGSTLLEIRQNAEQSFAKKVTDFLADIPGALVTVTVSVNNQTTEIKKTTVDEKKSGHFELKTTSENQEQNTPAATPSEAGAASNTGASIGNGIPAGGGESTATTNKEQAEFENVPAVTTESTKTAPGSVIPIAASVRIPRSHFVRFAKDMNDGKDPDPQMVKQTIADERKNMAEAVAKTLGLTNAADVSVEVYPDSMPVLTEPPTVTAASTVTLALGGHVKEIALGALALVSLFMVSAMVKKTGPALPAPAAPAPAAPMPRNILGGPELVAGEAGDGGTLLNAVEMDEESVRNQQMMEQVATLVDENPDTAATLVKRWMNRG